MLKTSEEIYDLIKDIPDPEIPVLSITDLGVIRKVEVLENEVNVYITPTYSGCPAMNRFEQDIKETLAEHNVNEVNIITIYEPAWTTDWISEEAKKRLEAHGIAPPVEKTSDKSFLSGGKKTVRCPQCKSEDTKLVSQFGSTACKAMYQCNACKEPFDYFKCI